MSELDLSKLAAPPTRVSDEGAYQSINHLAIVIQQTSIVNAVFNTAVALYLYPKSGMAFSDCITRARELVEEFNAEKPTVTV